MRPNGSIRSGRHETGRRVTGQWMHERALGVLLAGLVALAGLAGIRSVSAKPPPDVGPGCDADRPAVAHVAGGERLAKQPNGGPVVCGMYTGFAGGETRVQVTNTGAVIVTPAGTGDFLPSTEPPESRPQTILAYGGAAVSHDDGATWSLVKPFGMTWHQNDHETHVDRDTGRIFWAAMFKNPNTQTATDADENPDTSPDALQATAATALTSHILASPDDGRTWTYGQACCEIVNGPGLLTAKPPPGAGPMDQPRGYPNVVYYCWHASQTFPGKPAESLCSRSLDGGRSWEVRGHTHRAGIPVHPECPTPSSVRATPDESSETAGNPAAAPDGTLYVVVGCGGNAYLAQSTDEAATWPIVRALPHRGELQIDTAGNMYLMRSAEPNGKRSGTLEEHTKLLLSVSRDEGRTWSEELNVLAPGVTSFEAERTALYGGVSCCTNWYYDVREPGHVAVAYSGRTDDRGTALDGYITETRNALDILAGAKPMFWSATLNDPARPLKFFTGHPRGAGTMSNQVGMDIAPDGSPWASFIEDCGPTPQAQRCEDQHGQSRGFAGRLAWPDKPGRGRVQT